ncbi:AAA family ATPase [Affinirhizobium pseudoryzae]|uniref:AAA family ATPase n=1 Tax=Allorhizobium pseudoryzae TaxID=379684 RepID=UPI0013EAA82D|nr:AAA family ATPase [Allorhizobium pseudoryzae]
MKKPNKIECRQVSEEELQEYANRAKERIRKGLETRVPFDVLIMNETWSALDEVTVARELREYLHKNPQRGRELLLRELKAQKIDIPELFGDAPANGQKLVTATPYVWTDPSNIPKRRWLYGRQLIRGFVTVTVSPGGVGKSSLTMVEALSMVSGRPLLGKQPEERLRVWLWNLEDPADELQRRIQAACEHYDISAEDLSDGLFVDSGRLQGLCIAQSDPKGRTVIIKPVVAALAEELIARKIDVLIVDPFVSSHSVSENDNMAIDKVAKTWGRLADACGCAIHLVHHTRKLGSDAEVTAESSRGGKALTDAARVVRTINRMSADEGKEFGITQHRNFFRAFDDKSNMAPPPELSEWYELRNVVLPNGDHVGVVSRWAPPDAFDGVTIENLKAVQVAISRGDFREDIRASTWAGTVVAEVLTIDAGSPLGRHKIKRLLAKWIDAGALRIELVKDEKRRDRAFVRVGEWV